jgi:hypothetical protein
VSNSQEKIEVNGCNLYERKPFVVTQFLYVETARLPAVSAHSNDTPPFAPRFDAAAEPLGEGSV